MKLYNSLGRRTEDFSPGPARRVNIFVCGMTVYDEPHIGNVRTMLVYDALVKFFRFRLGWDVKYIQNITDIDDKIIFRAKESGVSWADIAKKYEEVLENTVRGLKITAPNEYPRATDHIPEIVSQVERLRDKGHAYLVEEDGWYFDTATFPEYGKLSGRTAQQAEDSVSRIDESIKKRNKADFALWKFSQSDEPGWESNLGFGRPGWHIEDTAITEKYFGPQYDIHGGGLDLIFPHHEAEIAQMESLSGVAPLVRAWVHAGIVTVNGEKMSKSKGNFAYISQVLSQYPVETIRMFVFSSHYRSPVDYAPLTLQEAHSRQKRLEELRSRLSSVEDGPSSIKLDDRIQNVWKALEDDFNTPKALAEIFEVASEVNRAIDAHSLSKANAQNLLDLIGKLDDIFNILTPSQNVPQEIIVILQEREEARKSGDYAKSDKLREEIEFLGYSVKDEPEGPRVTKKN